MTNRRYTREDIEAIKEILDGVPKKLIADWEGTNHYEIHNVDPHGGDFFWLCLDDFVINGTDYNDLKCDTEEGKELGKLLDMAAALPDAMGIIRQLEAKLEDMIDLEAIRKAKESRGKYIDNNK